MDEIKKIRRIPYGETNFEGIRKENSYYVDKTHYIPKIENGSKFFFFIRPRRFGKSLLMSMLRSYYDIREKDHFEELFGGLYIGDHPTEKRNSYAVLYLNFSMVSGNLGNYKDSLDAHCNNKFRLFCDNYADMLPPDTMELFEKSEGAISQLELICDMADKVNLPIYLFIDEYDHFTNDILSAPDKLDVYENETHGEGYLRHFFNSIKAGTDKSIKRCFITGVIPVTLDDLTSGFNIGSYYTTDEDFNGLAGFNEGEVREMLEFYRDSTGVFQHTIDELISIIAPYYDHYCFAHELYGKETMYNSNMVLYFLSNYIKRGEIPENMIDYNIRTDYNKLRMLIRKNQEYSDDTSVIQKIVNNGYTTGIIHPLCYIKESAGTHSRHHLTQTHHRLQRLEARSMRGDRIISLVMQSDVIDKVLSKEDVDIDAAIEEFVRI